MNEIWIREGLLLLGVVLGAVLGFVRGRRAGHGGSWPALRPAKSDTPFTQDVSLFFNP